jgi:two-component system chemotaxis response regulator CheY
MATILIVDDSQTMRFQVRQILTGAGHTAIEAADGREGLEKLRSTPGIDLILSDLNMPVMDGINMCQTAHKDPTLNKIPKVMLTTEASAELKAAGKAAGVIAWLIKPVNKDNLLLVINKILQPGARTA